MKKLYSPMLMCMIAFAVPAFNFAKDKSPVKRTKPPVAIAELTKHQWTIAEYNEKINDTLRNLTLVMMPCEKERILKYDVNNTYQIVDGNTKCNNTEVKNEGTWQYVEAENVLTEHFSSGRPVDKKILSLDEGLLKIQFEGEGKRIITITYLSEIGKKSDAKKDLYIDNSDPLSMIAQMIRENLLEQGKYTLVSLGDFTNGVNKSGGSSKRLVVAPLSDLTDPNKTVDENDRNSKYIEQGKAAGLDYVVTGSLISLNTSKGSDNKVSSRLKYRIIVLDVKKGKEKEKNMFAYPEEKKESVGLGGFGKILKKVADVAPGVFVLGALMGSGSGSLASLYALCYASQRANTVYSSASVFSSNVNESDRKQHFESSVSVLEAIEKTQPDLNKFLDKKVD